MAKKEKIELTPEEKAAKKIRHSNGWVRFWAIVVSFALTAAIFGAAKAGIGAPETKEVVATGTNNGNSDNGSSNANNSGSNNSSTGNNDASAGDNNTSNGDNNATAGDKNTTAPTDTATIIKEFNDAVSKAASTKPGYNWVKDTQYTRGLEVSGKDALNTVISKVDPNASVDSVVGNFIGIGGRKAAVTKGQEGKGVLEGTDGWTMNDYEALSASKLTADNVSKATKDGNTITVVLKDISNPQPGDGSALSNLTGDFLTLDIVREQVAAGLGSFSSLLKITDESSVNYTNISATVKLDDKGNVVDYKITYEFEASLSLKATIVPIKGNGAAKSVISYSDFKY